MMIGCKIFYICDKKKHCNENPSCAMYCHHTSDPDHAKNGAIRAPSEAVGRFIEMPVTDSNVLCYFERFDITSQRLKKLIKESGLSNKEFVHQFNEWLHKKQMDGLYNEQPDIREPHLSRWTKTNGQSVKMRNNKIRMFADYFHVDIEYLGGTQEADEKPERKKE